MPTNVSNHMDDHDDFDDFDSDDDVWEKDIPESDFDEFEIPWTLRPKLFDQSFRDRLQQVKENVEQQWPKLYDDRELDLLLNLRRGVQVSLTGRQNILVGPNMCAISRLRRNLYGKKEQLLKVYISCLECIQLYPHKKDKKHIRRNVKFFKRDIPSIVGCLWHKQFKRMYPYTAIPVNESLLLATSQFICALFDLYEEEYAELGLM